MTRLLAAVSVTALMAGTATAEMNFNRIASFAVHTNSEGAEETSSEIIDATADGMTLVYTDSPLGAVGFVDITDPAAPKAAGILDMAGEPTSVKTVGATAFVAVNTSESFTAPSGRIAQVDVATRTEATSCDLGGQPDSVAAAKDGSFLAIAIENERDEDTNDGALPQLPAGTLAIVGLKDGALDCASLKIVDLTGLAAVSPEDPEPEFVDINGAGEIVVTLQENNHIAIVGSDGTVLSHFSAGAVDLTGIDKTDEQAALIFTESQGSVLREPDGAVWIDDTRFATANEGDLDGGSRSWTIWNKDGSVAFEDAAALEKAVAKLGHHPDRRSDSKGIEPEAVESATFDATPLVFVGAERASVVGVYDATDAAAPKLLQILPSGIGPEGLLAIPQRGLLVTANEVDLGADGGARSHVMIYQRAEGPAVYPHVTSEGLDSIAGWGANSGMVADGETTLWAVNDSFYGYQPTIFRIDVSQTPARIVEAIPVTRRGAAAQKLDMEGITLDGEGGFWVASEGRTDRVIPHALYHVRADGRISAEIGLPPELNAVETRFGFEGITLKDGKLWMAVQREWGDDPEGSVKLVSYDIEAKEWGAVRYPLEPKGAGWMGLSEIVAHGDWVYVVERDNLVGDAAVVKRIYRIPAAQMVSAPLGGELPVVTKELVRDLLPDLKSTGGYVLDKVEGLAITPAGNVWVSTDNDGVDDHSGETMLWQAGSVQ